jgi:hypothetical protein
MAPSSSSSLASKATSSVFKIEALVWVSLCRALKFQLFSWRVGSNLRHQFKNIEMNYKTHNKLVHESYGTCFQYDVQIKNQPSNSTSCSDNALRLLVLVVGILYRGLQGTSPYSIWGCALKGCFKRGIFWRAKSRLKGIEDFNLEHCTSHTRLRLVTNSLALSSVAKDRAGPSSLQTTLEGPTEYVSARWM